MSNIHNIYNYTVTEITDRNVLKENDVLLLLFRRKQFVKHFVIHKTITKAL